MTCNACGVLASDVDDNRAQASSASSSGAWPDVDTSPWSIVGGHDENAMDRTRIYFTWPDGRFTYECATCGACCRGLGIGLDATGGQTRRLLTLYPGLTPFMRKRGATYTAFNPRGQCWFLTDDGLCRVEVEHGRADKPASCQVGS